MNDVRVAIVGSGFGGIGLGIRLLQAGIRDFVILEKGERLGGTWRDNTYPGAACDLMSFAYCFSFEQKTDWTRKWSRQPEILAYLDHCAENHGLSPHIRFGAEVEEARFDAAAGRWRVRVAAPGGGAEVVSARVLVSAVGQLHRPAFPKIAGLDAFRGEWFHSARWNHGVELDGGRVAVIGNAASAIQFVPEIAPRVESLSIFQRSPNWIVPRGDRAYSEAERRRFTRHPWLARLYRWLIWARQEAMYPAIRGRRYAAGAWRKLALANLHRHIRDPELRALLTPDYPVGAKRILIDDDYYPTLLRENVELVTSPIDHAEPDALVTEDGARRPFDALIFATGFQTSSFLAPMRIEGLDGRVLEDEWVDGAEAYLGLSVSGFPNFYMMYGPNTNLGHNSIIFMLECQAGYILQMIRMLERRGLRYLDLDPEVQRAFNARLHDELSRTAWARIGKSWYKTAAGRITNNWAGTTTRYWWHTRRPRPADYRAVS